MPGLGGIEVSRQGDNSVMAGFSAVVRYFESETKQPVALAPFMQ